MWRGKHKSHRAQRYCWHRVEKTHSDHWFLTLLMNLLFRHTFLIHQRWTISQQLQLLQTKQLQQQSSAKEEVSDSIFIFLLCGIVKSGQVLQFVTISIKSRDGQTLLSFCTVRYRICTHACLYMSVPLAEALVVKSTWSWLYGFGKHELSDSSIKGDLPFWPSIHSPLLPVPCPAAQYRFLPFVYSLGGFLFSLWLLNLASNPEYDLSWLNYWGSPKLTRSHAWFVLWASNYSTVSG